MDKEILDSDKPITLEYLKELFQSNDFTTSEPTYDVSKADSWHREYFSRTQSLFKSSFQQKFTELCKKRLKNFSKSHPANVLENADRNIVTDAVMQIADDPAALDNAFKLFFAASEDTIIKKAEAYADKIGKEVDDLTEDETVQVLETVIDNTFDNMMSLLIQTQSLPEIMGVVKSNSVDEDFNPSVLENHDRIDHDRKMNHLRTKIGRLLSFDDFEDDDTIFSDADQFASATDEEMLKLCTEFIDYLDDDVDKEIVRMKLLKIPQAEIATRLKYKSQGAISKRLTKMREKADEFLRTHDNPHELM